MLRANFVNNPNNRSYQPRAYAPDYTIPERVYQYSASVQQELPGGFVATAAYVGSQGRNLFLRSWANKIIGGAHQRESRRPTPIVIREFDIVNGSSIQRPFAEVDYKTSGGHDSYNSMQLSRRAAVQLGADAQLAVHARRAATATPPARTRR